MSHDFTKTDEYAGWGPKEQELARNIIDKYGQIFWGEVFDTIEEAEKFAEPDYSIWGAWEDFGVTLVEICGDMHQEILIVKTPLTPQQEQAYQGFPV